MPRDPADIIAGALTGVLNPHAAKERAAVIIAALDEAAAAEQRAYRPGDIVQVVPGIAAAHRLVVLTHVFKDSAHGYMPDAGVQRLFVDLRFEWFVPTGGRIVLETQS